MTYYKATRPDGYRQAHRPEPRWRWYVGLVGETAFLLAMVAAIAIVAGLAR